MPPAASRRRTLRAPRAHPVNLRAIVAEFVGTAMLLLAVVGSGIMAERLCGGNVGLALLANALATGGALVALILASRRAPRRRWSSRFRRACEVSARELSQR